MGFFGNLFSSGFDDPKTMSNNKLIASIAGQADWLEKMIKSPIETQVTPSIIELTKKRKNHIANLCLEVISRKPSSGEPMYPGATTALNIFEETTEKAKEIEATGVSQKNSAVRAVKDILFTQNGVFYAADWEI